MDREAFLDRVAARLGRARKQRPPARTLIGVPNFDEPSANIAATAALLQMFSEELTAVGGGVKVVRTVREASAALRAEIAHFEATRVVTSARTEFAQFELDWLWRELGARAVLDAGMRTEAEQREALAQAQIGVTTVTCAIANTGSLLVTAAPTRPRALSLLPSVHVALLFAGQILPTLGAAFARLGTANALPSGAHVITGPSRTSDIENDLTIGVHGPSAVTAIVIEEEQA